MKKFKLLQVCKYLCAHCGTEKLPGVVQCPRCLSEKTLVKAVVMTPDPRRTFTRDERQQGPL